MRPLRLVPDGTAIKFMRGRFAGVIVSAILSIISVVLFFYPGFNLGVDFRGGIVVELRGPHPLPADTIREAFAPLGFGDLRVQEFGSPRDALIRFENKSQLQDAQRVIAARVAEALPDVQMRRIDTHAKLPFEAEPDVQKHSDKCECGRHQAVAKQLPAHPGAHDLVATLILDITKDDRVLRDYTYRIRPQFRGGVVDPDRLFRHRQGCRLRSHPREPRQIPNYAVAAAD